MTRTNTSLRGFTLTSLLIGVGLSILVSTVVLQALFQIKRNAYEETSSSALFENGRYASFLLKKFINNSGYLGCFQGVPMNHIKSDQQLDGAANYDFPVMGYQADDKKWAPTLPTYISNASPKEGTDVLVIKGIKSTTAPLVNAMSSKEDRLVFSNAITPQKGDVLFVGNCEQADLFRVESTSSGSGTHTVHYTGAYNIENAAPYTELSAAYDTNALVGEFYTDAFFIKDDGQGHSALWLYRINAGGVPETVNLVENVSDLQVEYGVDVTQDGSANAYVPACSVSNWSKVVSLRLHLLLKSSESSNESASSYTFMNQTVTTQDQYVYREFVSTIKIGHG